ncbi:MAG: hypothetical protein ACRC8S_19040 [Fimbriiglobus sp.]
MAVIANPFHGWLAEVAADLVVVRPDDIIAEALGNLWTFNLTAEERAVVTVADVEEFIWAIAAARGRWLTGLRSRPMRLYCWHDAQAGQLRFSLVSDNSGLLPFACAFEPVSELRAVVREFLGPTADGPQSPLLVWVAMVPPDAA